MIGIIVTGHGNFGSGMTSSLNLIVGSTLENYKYVDFDGNSTDELEKNIKKAIDELSICDGILICSDLVGGSPFKTAVMASVEQEGIKVIAGTNLPMLIDIMLTSQSNDDIDEFAKYAAKIGSDMILVYEQQIIEDGDDKENGI